MVRGAVLPYRSRSNPRLSPSFEQRGLELLRRDEFQESRYAFFRFPDSALDRRDDFGRLRHPLAVAAESPGHVSVIARDVGTAVFLRCRLHDRNLTGHGEIVEKNGE